MRVYVSPDVFYGEIQGFLIVLDLRTESYFIFDPVAALMWKTLLVTDTEAETIEALQSKYSVDRAQLKADLEAFTRRCIEQGFLHESEPDRTPAIPLRIDVGQPKFLTVRAWWCLFRAMRSLSTKGLLRTYQEYAGLPIPKVNSRDADSLLKRPVAAFALAENFFLLKRAPKDCLPRSLALFRFLRSTGLPVEHHIGVRQFPFQAHAWVEFHGRVVLDDPSRQAIFTTLARIAA